MLLLIIHGFQRIRNHVEEVWP